MLIVLGRDSYDEKNHRVKWRCHCDCGQETVAFTRSLQRGTRTDRGCMELVRRQRRSAARRLPQNAALIKRLISSYRNNATQKDIAFALSRETMGALFVQECFSCGSPPGTTITRGTHNGACTSNGIDRLRNTGGYVPGNVVAWCQECNVKKGAQDVGPFLTWVARVAEHQRIGDGQSNGTAHMMQSMRALGKPVVGYRVDHPEA